MLHRLFRSEQPVELLLYRMVGLITTVWYRTSAHTVGVIWPCDQTVTVVMTRLLKQSSTVCLDVLEQSLRCESDSMLWIWAQTVYGTFDMLVHRHWTDCWECWHLSLVHVMEQDRLFGTVRTDCTEGMHSVVSDWTACSVVTTYWWGPWLCVTTGCTGSHTALNTAD
jgi:hypothetical protein